ncbi:hypothetical protein DBR17_15305, partial [Sphingomonas sp. HMWF008]
VLIRTASAAFAAMRSTAPLSASSGRPSLFVCTARIDNKAEVAARFGLDPRADDRSIVRDVFEARGAAGVADLVGGFAFAHWSDETRTLTLARDCVGQHSLFYATRGNVTRFASSLRLLLALPDMPREIDERALANYMALNLYEGRRTFYRGIDRVPSRALVHIDVGQVQHRRYWSPQPLATPLGDERAYIERGRELFDQAVADAIRDLPEVAISTSGGLDSSAVAATVARLRGPGATAYAGVLPAGVQVPAERGKYTDERDKVEALGRMHPSLALRFVAPTGAHTLDEDPRRFFAAGGVPTFAATNLGWHAHIHDAAARDGHRVLLTGSAGNFGLTWGGAMSLIGLLRQGRVAAFQRELRCVARETGETPWQILKSEVVRRALPVEGRWLIERLRGRDPHDIARHSSLSPDMIETLGLRAAWKADRFDSWLGMNGTDPVKYRTEVLFDFNQPARDLAANSTSIAGLATRDPHADRRLLEFTLAVPERLFRKDGVKRSFARNVLADRLPPDILHERRTGVQAIGQHVAGK